MLGTKRENKRNQKQSNKSLRYDSISHGDLNEDEDSKHSLEQQSGIKKFWSIFN